MMKMYLSVDYIESVMVLWALKDLYSFNAQMADDEYLKKLEGLIKQAEHCADKLYEHGGADEVLPVLDTKEAK